jgi:hypothetical protein
VAVAPTAVLFCFHSAGREAAARRALVDGLPTLATAVLPPRRQSGRRRVVYARQLATSAVSRGLWHVCSNAMTRVESDVPVRRCLATSARADSVGLAQFVGAVADQVGLGLADGEAVDELPPAHTVAPNSLKSWSA